MVDEKKKYRVVGIDMDKTMPEYATAIENAMNSMTENGYRISIIEVNNPLGKGAVIVGERIEMQVVGIPLSTEEVIDVLRGQATSKVEGTHPTHPLTERVLSVIERVASKPTTEKNQTEVLKNVLEQVTRGVPVAEVAVIAKDLWEIAEAHEKRHGPNGCEMPGIIREAVGILRASGETRTN